MTKLLFTFEEEQIKLASLMIVYRSDTPPFNIIKSTFYSWVMKAYSLHTHHICALQNQYLLRLHTIQVKPFALLDKSGQSSPTLQSVTLYLYLYSPSSFILIMALRYF